MAISAQVGSDPTPPAAGRPSIDGSTVPATARRPVVTAPQSSVRRPPGLGEEVEAGIGGVLDSSPSQLPTPVPASVADLQESVRRARVAAANSTASLRAVTVCPGRHRQHRALPRSISVGGPRIEVIAGHSGAGASTVALAVAEAAAAQGRLVHLIECAEPARSGLAAAASAELGFDTSGQWRRGERGLITVDRRASDTPSDHGAIKSASDSAKATQALTILDLAETPDAGVDGVDPCHVLVVVRVSVPGVLQTEAMLGQLDAIGAKVVVAAVGPNRWPGAVGSSAGPKMRSLRKAGQVVAVPVDKYLAVSGISPAPLPRSLVTAGRSLLTLLAPEDDASGAGAADDAPIRIGRTR